MKSIFIIVMSIFLLFNTIYTLMNPSALNTMVIGAFIGLIATVVGLGVISGITILGSGLNAESIRILFSVGTLLNFMFQVTIAGFPIGIGLANNILNIFLNNDFYGLGIAISMGLSVIAIVSGVMSIVD